MIYAKRPWIERPSIADQIKRLQDRIAILAADLDQCRALKLRNDSAHRDEIARLREYASIIETHFDDEELEQLRSRCQLCAVGAGEGAATRQGRGRGEDIG